MSLGARRCWQTACLALFLVLSCRSRPADDLLRMAPGLSPEIALHLVNDDPEAWRVFARRQDAGVLSRALWILLSAPATTSLSEFRGAETALAPYQQRVIDGIYSDYRLDLGRRFYAAYWRCALTERFEIVRCQQDRSRLGDLPLEEHAAAILQLVERFQRHPNVLDPSDLYGEYASLLPQLHREPEIPKYLTLGIDSALRYQDYDMACQLLGTLGFHYGRYGDLEAMRRSYDRALDYARRVDSYQEARILSLYATAYRSHGQLAITRDLLFEAQDRCRELRVGFRELRHVTDTLKFLASLDCWDLVGRGLPRAEMVYERSRSDLDEHSVELEGVRLQVLRARYCSNIGRCDEARRLALDVATHVDQWTLGPTRTALSRLEAAQALAKCGHVTEACGLLEKGLRGCIDGPVPELVDRYAVELASAQLDLGELEACGRTLVEHPDVDFRVAVQHAILGLRLAIARHDRATAFSALQIGLQRLAEMEAELGASPESYIALATNDELRRLGHQLLDDSAEAGYAFEMRWRLPVNRAPRFISPGLPEKEFVATLVADARRLADRLATRSAMHCVYDVRDDAVIRFTATENGITQERLACSVADLQARVGEACTALGRPAARSPQDDPNRAERLRILARWLLPDLPRTDGDPPLLLLTANGCLSRLPFEALNVAPQGYVPLLGRSDVAALRYWGGDEPARGDSVLIVSQPTYSATLQRRYSILAEELPNSAAEAHVVEQTLPRVLQLTGQAAIKGRLVQRWERSRLIYFAGHLVQNPELPYVMFIPLAETPNGTEEDSYLEVADVRQADLSNCQLVVLSSCGSGASYRDTQITAPSLADVFLDAGARAVVSTAWAVRDDAAARVMGNFVREYGQNEGDPIGALCRTRRAVAADNPDPHFWVAYSITVQSLGRATGGPMARAAAEKSGAPAREPR